MRKIEMEMIEESFFKRGNPLKKLLKVSLDLFKARHTGVLYGTNYTNSRFLHTSMWDRGIIDKLYGKGPSGLALKFFGKTVISLKQLSPVYFFKEAEYGSKVENDGVISFVLRNCAEYYSKGISVLICPDMGRHLSQTDEQYVYIPFYCYDGTNIKKPDRKIKTDTKIVKQFNADNSIYIYLPAYGILVINTADKSLVKMEGENFINGENLKKSLDLLIKLVETSSLAYLGQLKGKKGAELLWRKERHLRETSTELIDNEIRYRDLYENAPVAYFSTDQDGTVLACNKNAQRLSGYDEQELIGKNVITMFVNKMEMIQIPHYIRQHIKKGEPIKDMELQMRQRSGTTIWVNLSIDAVKTKIGEVEEFRVIAVDITQRKNLEAKLMQAQKMEAIGTLAGGIAHDFNNILSPISGYTEMLLMDIEKDRNSMENLSIILDCTKHAKNLVTKLLTFSRQKEHEFKPIQIKSSIKEALVLARSLLPATIRINDSINKDCGYIMADPVQLHQVIMNILANAFQAMEKDGGELDISVEKVFLKQDDNPQLTSDGIYVYIKIADSGPGIDKELLDHIFDPYFTTKADGKGTGLGLSVVHGIVTSHGGFIDVESHKGQGTEFKIYLPSFEGDVDIEEQIKQDLVVETGTEKILMIEDDEKVALMQRQMLEKLGYQVTCHLDCFEAIETFNRQPKEFDLVVTDMTMPGMNGYQLSREIYKINPDVPVILCTGYNERIDDVKMADHGIVDLLNKPVGVKAFSFSLRKAINTRKESKVRASQ